MKEVYIISALRTPIGSFGGSLARFSATQLGAIVIRETIQQSGIQPKDIDEVLMGNVLSANLGQAPARQAALFAGIPHHVPCTTINKVCASGMKSIMLGAQSILAADNDVVLTGGMESMSNVPHYLHGIRSGKKLGHNELTDGLIKDGLWDVYNDFHMGQAAEMCAHKYKISREDQDQLAIESYKRALSAAEKQQFKDEIVPVEIPQKKGAAFKMDYDEEAENVNFDKIPKLRPVFQEEGTITAANASTINDGAAALLLVSKEKAEALNLKPLARLVAYTDAAQEPGWFTTAPVKAIQKLLHKTQWTTESIDLFEINEAFAVVSLAAIRELHLDPEKVNVKGSGVSLGHPLGTTGARIVVTLLHSLRQRAKKRGVAALCNGGGGASALAIELI